MGEFVVFDIDGVLADVRHRLHHLQGRPKQWDAFFAAAPGDSPLSPGVDLLHTAVADGLSVVYSTGRPERCRQDTVDWFVRHGIPRGELRMRNDRDRRPARLVKLAVALDLHSRGTVAYAVDDDRSVVETLRSAGFEVIHATWMSEGGQHSAAPQQQMLFDAQERGLT